MKKFFSLALCFLSVSAFSTTTIASCGQAEPTASSGFCGSFKRVAQCQCLESPSRPKTLNCNDMNSIFNVMSAVYGSMPGACAWQEKHIAEHVPKQVCIDDWNTYRGRC